MSYVQEFQPTALLKLVTLFLSSHSNGSEVLHFGFNLYFPKDQHAEYF
jgi:hypothetical protein